MTFDAHRVSSVVAQSIAQAEQAFLGEGRAGLDRRLRLRGLLVRGDRLLGERLARWNAIDGGDASFSAASARAYRAQVQMVSAEVQAGLGRLATDLSQASWAAGAARATTELSQLEAAFTGVVRSPRIVQAMRFDESRGRGASLLRSIDTSADRYGQYMISQFEGQMQLGLVAGLTQTEMVEMLTGHGGPRGEVSIRARVVNGRVVRTETATIHEGLFVARRAWAQRIVRTEISNAYNGAKVEALSELQRSIPGLRKKILAHFDARTATDSVSVHGQVRSLNGPDAFFTDGAGRVYEHPPARPNDRETVIPWEDEWPDVPSTAELTPGQVSQTNDAIAQGRPAFDPAVRRAADIAAEAVRESPVPVPVPAAPPRVPRPAPPPPELVAAVPRPSPGLDPHAIANGPSISAAEWRKHLKGSSLEGVAQSVVDAHAVNSAAPRRLDGRMRIEWQHNRLVEAMNEYAERTGVEIQYWRHPNAPLGYANGETTHGSVTINGHRFSFMPGRGPDALPGFLDALPDPTHPSALNPLRLPPPDYRFPAPRAPRPGVSPRPAPAARTPVPVPAVRSPSTERTWTQAGNSTRSTAPGMGVPVRLTRADFERLSGELEIPTANRSRFIRSGTSAATVPVTDKGSAQWREHLRSFVDERTGLSPYDRRVQRHSNVLTVARSASADGSRNSLGGIRLNPTAALGVEYDLRRLAAGNPSGLGGGLHITVHEEVHGHSPGCSMPNGWSQFKGPGLFAEEMSTDAIARGVMLDLRVDSAMANEANTLSAETIRRRQNEEVAGQGGYQWIFDDVYGHVSLAVNGLEPVAEWASTRVSSMAGPTRGEMLTMMREAATETWEWQATESTMREACAAQELSPWRSNTDPGHPSRLYFDRYHANLESAMVARYPALANDPARRSAFVRSLEVTARKMHKFGDLNLP